MIDTVYARPPALIFGVPIDNLSMEEALDAVGESVHLGRRDRRTYQIATVNVDFLVNSLGDAKFKQLLQGSDLCLADGMPVVWGARALGMPLMQRVAGSDLVPALAERAATTGWRIHFFGSAPGIAERAAALLRARHPGIDITAASGPIISDITQMSDEFLDEITAIDPDILCVALGNPKQEHFIDAFRSRLKTPLMLGIGGSLDMLVGKRKRAPKVAQHAGLEWLVRAAQEPGRLGRRYAHDAAVYFPGLVSERRSLRRARGDGGIEIKVSGNAENMVLSVCSSSTDGAPANEWSAGVHSLANGATLHLGLDAGALTVRALAQLVGLVRAARRYGCEIEYAQIADPIVDQASALGLCEFVGSP
ncbi:WecB/TagA/CpsF family glycosyltransferase [Mycobacterium sp. OTB74]|uniref:WecB/TagA/CpsF family glycosyltransferase n=1 Tax=Mycobacterium sp. OTB74 TaxID=1853452 RepID=UPI0024733E9E|nr:WecB/TagA/CpsF family glycosyltransferase [Mycobacterium sp. OTB74]MDH6242407.1 exopolysaccharide biosynthesis WecB/TagA/CpsF family protein [Mycobacterium sp. OTB74]